ncbi:MAG: hypothetical protein ACRDHW_02250 [Ktedonobacteraceae bacterium]
MKIDDSDINPDEDLTQNAASASEMPTMPLPQNRPDETLPTLDDLATVTMLPDTTDAPTLTTPFHAAPTEQGVPPTLQAQGYGQPGALGNMSKPGSYPGAVSGTAQPGAPSAFYPPNVYPPQPGASKKRSKLLLLAIVALVVLLLGGGSVFAYVTIQANASTPLKTLQQFCNGLKTQNAQEVYDTFSTEEKAKASLPQLEQSFDELKNLNLVKFSGCIVGEIQQNNSTAVGQVAITTHVSLLGLSTDTSATVAVNLVLENGAWKVSSDPTHISNGGTLPPGFLTPTVNQ